MRSPSKYQKAIFEAYNTTNSNLLVNACPGSGKTTTILELIKQTPAHKKVLLSAFNKSIQLELSSKIQKPNLTISTIHALGYRFLRDYMNSYFKLNEYKNWIFAKKHLKRNFKSDKERNVYIAILSHLMNMFKMNAGETLSDMERIADYYGILTLNGELEDALLIQNEIDKYNNQSYHKEFIIDFTDMLYLSVKLVPESLYTKFDVVFIDETQDLNPLQKIFIDRTVKPGGRFVAVGDDKQAIYGFMGSNLDSFNELRNRPNTIELPLSVCYRCDKSIVKEAFGVFDDIEEFEEKQEGIVRKGKLEEIEEGDYLLCRNNFPLIQSFISLIAQKKRVRILGKDFGEGLLNIIRSYKDSQFQDFYQFRDFKLDEKIVQLKEKGVINPLKSEPFIRYQERFQIIVILLSEFNNNFDEVKDTIEHVFSDTQDKNHVTLSTIHKAKGLEADRVFILGYEELLPSPYAQSQQELYAERCLAYVAITRAKKELVYIPYTLPTI